MSDISRRTFIGTGAVAAGAFTILKPELVRGSAANSKVTVGLIGCGGRGTYDATLLQKDGRAEITTLCDLFDDRLEQAQQRLKLDQPTRFKEFEKVLSSNVDAVLI